MSARAQRILTNATRVLLLMLLFGGVVWYNLRPISRAPDSIQLQTPFTILVPQDRKIALSEWRYNASEKNLSFTATVQGKKVILTQQAAPLAYRDDKAAYDRFVGTLRPTANFRSPLGTVSLFRLVEEGTYNPGGDSAILLAHDTLLIAHPPEAISEDDWIRLFQTFTKER